VVERVTREADRRVADLAFVGDGRDLVYRVNRGNPTIWVASERAGEPPREVASGREPIRPMPNARMVDDVTAVVTWPADVWFSGGRSFQADLDFGPRRIERITLDPSRRFPDRDPSDNVWTGQTRR